MGKPSDPPDDDIIEMPIPARLAFMKDAFAPLIAALERRDRQRQMGLPVSDDIHAQIEHMRNTILSEVRKRIKPSR